MNSAGSTAAAMAVAACLTVSACSPDGVLGNDGAKTIKIGYAVPRLDNSYWAQNVAFAQRTAGQLGVKLSVASAGSSESRQLKDIQHLISLGVHAIVYAPVTASVGPSILDSCKTAKIKCVAVARRPGLVPDSTNAAYNVGYVVGNDEADGEAAAATLTDAGVKVCVTMGGQRDDSVADGRLKGFQDYATTHGVTILDTFRPAAGASEGQRATESFLAAYPGPGFDCLFAFDGDAATGAVSALKANRALSKVKVSAVDANPDDVKAISSGDLLASAAGGEYVEGGFATIMAYDAVMGFMPPQRQVVLDGIVVTEANVDQYSARFGSTATGYDAKRLSLAYSSSAPSNRFTLNLD
ncbi:sugar ABC transporter substrate-binding protein [Kitasatospora sp. NPDC001603]|uniref:sugar ABC transporter substrate-binding protein n=1 Tax=Kitasatospora sp. NPDC001603 TaxID=3154388 RepID=UPI0033191E32